VEHVKSETMRTSTGRFSLSLLAAVGALLGAGNVQADTNIVTTDSGWEIFTAGRVNSFLNYFSGQGIPNNAEGVPTGGMLTQDSPTVHTVVGGGGVSSAQNSTARDEGKVRTGAGICPPGYDCQTVPQGTANGFRIRSGFLANVFGFGVRKALTPTTKFTAYIESWAQIESDGRRKYVPVPSDVRQGFIKIEGGWGSFLAGRALTLFSAAPRWSISSTRTSTGSATPATSTVTGRPPGTSAPA
jgi:hypothetical protein